MFFLLCPPIPEFLHALCLSTFSHVREYLLPQSLLYEAKDGGKGRGIVGTSY